MEILLHQYNGNVFCNAVNFLNVAFSTAIIKVAHTLDWRAVFKTTTPNLILCYLLLRKSTEIAEAVKHCQCSVQQKPSYQSNK